MRKVFLVIERRADYSRYRPIMLLLQKDPFFKLHIVVTGLCLMKAHGEDIRYIRDDGFTINNTIPMFRENAPDTGAEMVRAMARFLPPVVDELEKEKPDLVLSGFDIGANFAVTMAAAHMNIPVAHIQGGEVTGSIDESLRHGMSKFAHLHFAATKQAKKRLIRMGERPDRIFVVGCPSIDTLISAPVIPTVQLEHQFSVTFSKPVALVIQHPVTTEFDRSETQFAETIAALKTVNLQTIFLLPNNDAGFSSIVKLVRSSGFRVIPSLSVELYANLLQHISVLAGNSSSGIHEAATFGVPVVNIGNRQQGREHGKNVIDVPNDRNLIAKALEKAVTNKSFLNSLKRMKNMYGNGHASEKIVKLLKDLPLTSDLIAKQFYE